MPRPLAVEGELVVARVYQGGSVVVLGGRLLTAILRDHFGMSDNVYGSRESAGRVRLTIEPIP